MTYLPYTQSSYTPVVTVTGAGTAPTYIVNLGTFTKIGRVVFFQISLSGNGGTAGAGGGAVTISIPYLTSASQNVIIATAGQSVNGAQEHLLYAQMNASSSTFTIKYQANANQTVNLTGADQDNATRSIYMNCKYITDL